METCPIPLFDSMQYLSQSKERAQSLDEKFRADFENASLFLKSYMGSQGTFNSYRREVERFLHWSWLMHQTSIQALRREDIETYIRFCQSPPAHWIGLHKVPRFIEKEGIRQPNLAWRPFVATVNKVARKKGKRPQVSQFAISTGAITETFAILSTFYQFLLAEGYVLSNPIALIRQKSKFIRKRQAQAPIRRLSMLQWHQVLASSEIIAETDKAMYERLHFILVLLFGLYLRISELVASERWSPQMNHFTKDTHGNWWFTTVGKGNKFRQIAVPDSILEALTRWRTFLGLTALPSAADTSPLLPKLKGQGPLKDTAWVREMVQRCFDLAEAQLREAGQMEEADTLASATVHWLRHTGISEDVKLRPREHVRDDAGHSSSATTDRYIDIELLERHRSAKNKIV